MGARYITTTLPYVNASPHIGFGAELVRADTLARAWRAQGDEIFFNTGTDEHGQKIYDKAVEAGENPQVYVDRYATEFRELIPALGISEDIHFIRTTDPKHIIAAQKMWQLCNDAGDIYKARQVIKYCVGCELEKTDSELINERCPLHPQQELEIREEENYFFRFSRYQQPLLDLYAKNPHFVIPAFRQEEIKIFVESGLRDFSISRLRTKMPWGVPVPGDEEHTMYVWFDALTSYLSTLGWPQNGEYKKWWPGTQLAGKDNLRQQAAIWQAMLLSAGLPNSSQIFIGGFVTSGGQKMSKSIGNVISPYELVAKYGTDATRYLLLRHVHPFDDSDITWERLDEWYTANLVNGLGNLVARVMKLAEEHLRSPAVPTKEEFILDGSFSQKMESFRFNEAIDFIFGIVTKSDEFMQEHQPYKKIKAEEEFWKEEARKEIFELVHNLIVIAVHLQPIMPTTSETILKAVLENKKPENLFPRLV